VATKWITVARGVRYREHPERKHAKRPDRYYTLAYKLDGKTITEGIGWWSEGVKQEDCERIMLELRANYKSGTGPFTYKEMRQSKIDETTRKKELELLESSLTLTGIFEGGYLAAQNTKNPKSVKSEKQLMQNHVVPFFHNFALRDITPSKMDEFLNHLLHKTSVKTGKKLSPASIRYILATVRQIWNYGLSRGITDMPYPAQRMKQPQADNRRTRFLTKEEAENLLDTLKERSRDVHDISLLSLFCGLRIGEIFKIQWSDINFQEEFIHIRDRKNKESGVAWMIPRVKEMLENRSTEQNSHVSVFPAKTGDAKQFMSKLFTTIISKSGLNDNISDARDKVVFHTLRHTYASWLAQQGVPLHTLAGLMGHKTTTMTQRYAHLDPKGLKAAAMLLDSTIKK